MEKDIKKPASGNATVDLAAERPHHPTSPSKLQSIEWCPHYESREQDTPHPMTLLGSAQHNVIETGEIPDDMSDEDAAMAMERRQFIEDRVNMLLNQYDSPVKMLTEEYLPIDDKPSRADSGALFKGTTAGYLDCGLVYDNQTKAEIHDWKFGNWDVEPASNNLQGIAYALGLCKRFPKLAQVGVYFHIPRVHKEPQYHLFTREDLEKERERVEAVVARAVAAGKSDPEMKMAHPGYPVCAFCGKIAECKALFSKVKQVAAKYSELHVPEDISPLSMLSKEDQNASMQLTHVVSTWANAFKNRIKDRILEGKAKCPDNFMLVSYTEREIVDPKKFEEVVCRHATKRAWQQLKKSLVPSLTAVTKLVRSRAERGKKDAAEEEFNDALFSAGAVQRTEPVAFLRAKRSSQKKQEDKTEE